MTPQQIHDHIITTYDQVHPKNAWGETSFFVNPGGKLPSGSYFATLKEKNGENDKASGLDRAGVFRLNFGPGKKAFEKFFGPPPARPAKGDIIEGPWDFEALDTLMPHPIYGWMSWMAVLNPTSGTFANLAELLDASYEKANMAVQRRLKDGA